MRHIAKSRQSQHNCSLLWTSSLWLSFEQLLTEWLSKRWFSKQGLQRRQRRVAGTRVHPLEPVVDLHNLPVLHKHNLLYTLCATITFITLTCSLCSFPHCVTTALHKMWLMAIWAAHWIVPNTASLQPLRSGGDCSDFTLDFSHISPRILLYFLKGNCLISNRVISSCVLNTSYMESPGSISLVRVLLMHDITVLSVVRFLSHTVSFSLFL